MPKAKNPISEEERSRRFEAEVTKRKKAGEFDQGAAENAVATVVKRSRNKG